MNPLLDMDISAPVGRGEISAGDDAERFVHHVKKLPVSPKKLRHMCNLTKKLYWREACLQLEFCRKNIAIHVKNGIAEAARLAEEQDGLDPTRLIVEICTVGKGTYLKGIDYKAKGRAGVLRSYQAHLYIVLKQVSEVEIQRTKYYSRWRKTQRLLNMPWEDRIKELPRYKPIPGYEIGERRVQDVFALVGTGAEEGAGQNRRASRPPAWQLQLAKKKSDAWRNRFD